MAYKKIEVIGAELVSVNEAKIALGLDPNNPADDEYNNYLSLCIVAARERIEESTGLLLNESRMVYVNDRFDNKIELLKCPLIEVEKVEYRDRDGATQEIPLNELVIDNVSTPARIQHRTGWPVTDGLLNAVTVTYKAGYAAGKLPELLIKGVMYLINHYFENRDMVVTGTIVNTVPETAETIIKLFQIHPVI